MKKFKIYKGYSPDHIDDGWSYELLSEHDDKNDAEVASEKSRKALIAEISNKDYDYKFFDNSDDSHVYMSHDFYMNGYSAYSIILTTRELPDYYNPNDDYWYEHMAD